jgi:hypothetical protein
MSAQVAPISVDGAADALVVVAAFVALWRLQANLLLVVAAGAAIGVVRSLAG